MTRFAQILTLTLAVVALSQKVTLAAPRARRQSNQVNSNVAMFVDFATSKKNWRQGQGNQGRPNQSSANMPNTSKLDNELRDTGQSLNALASRISNIEKSVELARKRAQDIASMAKTLARIDGKVSRIKRQLESVSRIPQLRLLRPLVSNLEKVRKQLHKVRVKADQVNRDVVKPLVSRLKNTERKLESKVAEIRQAASMTQQARQKLSQFRSFVESHGFNRGEVRALEAMVGPVRSTIRPVNQMIAQMDRSLGRVDREFNSLAQKLNAVSKAKGSLNKLERDLSSVDKAARNLDKVLSKKISIKFPVKFSVSIRQLLEAPGKVLDIVLKPLEKLAEKALSPVLKKLKLEVRVPGEVNSLTSKLNNLKSAVSGIGSSFDKVERALKSQLPNQYQNQVKSFLQKSTSQLTR